MNLKETPAKGTRGFILFGLDNNPFFRVYDPKNKRKFVDYDLFHNDLEIEIIDNSAAFYQSKKKNYIDYNSKILGETTNE